MTRIDGNQLSQLQSQAKKSDTAQKSSATGAAAKDGQATAGTAASEDSVKISAEARQLNELEKSLDTQSFNKEKVSLIKQAVDDGTYKPNSMAIAQKMIDLDS